ncbi:hypothetical protein GGQ68_004771 [Sagittula marina]|uniref:Sulfotransferase domain-containing protein n=1 Tax=Sagittula marina TaxID=943940 RepID=A0A7W6GWG7_9RHOB|nr:sulfotransferase domain-containing protein [Sagittula marina]MBB3988414.1 hypothetical protein [Sagittula marina]
MEAKKFLIVVGLPKSGTTFLFSQASKRPDRFAMPWGNKEVDYFRRGCDLDAYLGLFDGAREGGADAVRADDRVRFDASPLYIDDFDTSLANMAQALEGHEVRIVVCLRDPMERAYSHYLHDVAQHQKIHGHADYSFWSPAVMAKYLFPLEPRLHKLCAHFGSENVFGFAFGEDMSRVETMLRDFAGLGDDWSLDLSDNPAPGFTSPQCFYNGDRDMEVPLQEKVYRLRAGHLLVVNRQFSVLRKEINRPLAEQIMMRQAALTRQFDTGMLQKVTRARIYDDTCRAAALAGIELRLSSAPKVLLSKVSTDLPPHILKQLEPLCSFDEAVAQMFEAGTQRTMNTLVQMPHAGPSLARDMARLGLSHLRDPIEPAPFRDIQRQIIHDYGPIPLYIEALMSGEVARGNYDAALELFDGFGGPRALLWPMDLAHFLKARSIALPEDVAQTFRDAGIRVDLPEST